MTDNEKKKAGLFYKVESREDALQLIKDSTNIWYILAAIMTALYAAMGAPGQMFIFPVLWVLMATGVRFLFSRVAAVILFLLSLLGAYETITIVLATSSSGGSSHLVDILIAIMCVWAAVRSIEATFLLTGQFAEPDEDTDGTGRPDGW